MANHQSSYRVRSIGDYVVGKQIGSGSFSVVWHARHKAHGTEVAIKEILTGRLNKKLEESLMSEIDILRNINHPNIIRLHDMIKEPGKIHLVLEYCKGGDLSMFIQRRQGKIPESTAVHFMHQLAAGLKVLREHQIIHRDLKPQNLLLSTNEDNSTLKIADFGFARSLQPRGLAETMCGSPLYMAPEIMQLQKYDAKADLWSVGAILFQLVTGRTPFTGINQIQLHQNIMKSTGLQFPPDIKDLSSDCMDLCQKLLRRNPVERLTFEEFFNHPFFSQRQSDEFFRHRRSVRTIDGFPFSNKEENSQEDNLPFILDDDSGPDRTPSFVTPPLRYTYGFSPDPKVDRRDVSKDMEISKYNRQKSVNTDFGPSNHKSSEANLRESLMPMDHRLSSTRSKVVDTLELIDQDYVLVSGPLKDASSSASVSKPSHLPGKPGSPPLASRNVHSTSSAPLPIIGGATSKMDRIGSLETPCSAPSGTSHGSIDVVDALQQPSTDCMARIRSLQHCASVIAELVTEKNKARKQLEAFSIQFVILAIWKEALDICDTQAASAIEASPKQETVQVKETANKERDSPDIQECLETAKSPQDVRCLIKNMFIHEVNNAEELEKDIKPGNTRMPDAMESIFQAALTLGKDGAVEEVMGCTEKAATFYSKGICLLRFLLVEAPSLILNPPFSLPNSERYRLRTFIDLYNNRLSCTRSQQRALLKGGDQCRQT